MGKKKSGGEEKKKQQAAVAFVLRVPTHCRCDGCGDKVRAAVRDLARRCERDGVVALDQSALATKGELAVVATAEADPEKLRRRLSKRTGKSVGLVFPKPPPATTAGGGGKDAALQQQQQAAQAHHGQPQPMPAGYAWNALQQQPHGGYAYPYPYPWVLQQQQQAPPPEPYFGSWGAYPHAGDLGGGGWFGSY